MYFSKTKHLLANFRQSISLLVPVQINGLDINPFTARLRGSLIVDNDRSW